MSMIFGSNTTTLPTSSILASIALAFVSVLFKVDFFRVDLLIGGDADGNGEDGHASDHLAGSGGVDMAFFGESESMLIAMDIGGANSGTPDGVYDFMVGYLSIGSTTGQPFKIFAFFFL